jgi:hypothetical protein
MLKKLLIPLLILYTSAVYGQTDYFVKDSVKETGYTLIDGGDMANSQFCQVSFQGQIVKFTPDDVAEYGFHDGRKFISMTIEIGYKKKKVFLQQLTVGKIILFYYRDTDGKIFYIKKGNDKLNEIRKNPYGNWTFKDELMKYLDDCENIPDPLTYVSYTKKSMESIINQYNTCSRTETPSIRYGLTGAFSISSPSKSKVSETVAKEVEFTFDKTFGAGVFVDIPLFQSYFSLHAESYFQKNAYSGTGGNENLRYDYIINSSSFIFPLLIRYTIPSSKIHPFFNLGITYCHNFKLKEELYSTEFSGSQAEIEEIPTGMYASQQLGLPLGAGISFPLTAKRAISVEARYTHFKGLGGKMFGTNNFLFLLAINI